ncbi:MAG: hypothetical protein CMJ50_01120 [Planctomycetaceae bacterium]|nr:hypothetical protein [Planctomycetaceae bacterium]
MTSLDIATPGPLSDAAIEALAVLLLSLDEPSEPATAAVGAKRNSCSVLDSDHVDHASRGPAS